MDFEWDDLKSDDCFVKRGFDFEAVIDVFRDPYRLVELDDRWDYGEERLRLIGKLDEKIYVLIFTHRSNLVRIISARRANAREVSGRINKKILDATTEIDIARHKKIDDDLAMRDAGKYAARVRKKMGLSQQEFSRKIGVPLETIRNWEQGKRAPTGAAKALLRILDRSPELALLALSA